MPAESPVLEIRVRTATGLVAVFSQSEPEETSRILEGFHPQKIFSQPLVVISSQTVLNAFPTPTVVSIDLVYDPLPSPAFPQHFHAIKEIAEKDFLERRSPESLLAMRGRKPSPGELVSALIEIEPVGGPEVYLEMAVEASPRLDRDLVIRHLFSSPSLPYLIPGGIGYLNTHTISRFAIYPGPPELSQGVWKAELQSLSRTVASRP